MKVAVPAERLGDKFIVSPHFGRASYVAIVEVSEGCRYRLVELVENPGKGMEHGRGRAMISMIQCRGVDTVIIYSAGPGALSNLLSRGVRVYCIDRSVTLDEAIKMLCRGELREVGPSDIERLCARHGAHG